MGSLFDGIGGFPLAAVRHGIRPVWASEIEAFPMEVTKLRFPNMIHVGDITKLNGAELPPVDIITGGSPCQDLSVAGARAGLAGKRSGLFMEQTRIVKEMRAADIQRGRTNQFIRPRYMVWENVPGAFSSGAPKGEDFRIVLEEILRICFDSVYVPGPYTGRWEPAGRILLGDSFSLAWRCLDAQYWGVAQRRKRIYLVADFGGTSAPKILLTRKACLGIIRRASERDKPLPPQLHEALEMQAGLRNCSGALGAQQGMKQQTFVACGAGEESPSVLCLNDQGGQMMNCSENITGTLRAQMHSHQPLVYENHGIDARYTGPHEVVPTISARCGTGGNNVPLIEGTPAVYCISGNTIDREPENGGNGLGCQENIAYTVTTSDRHAVYSRQRVDVFQENDVVSTESARQHKDATDLVIQHYQQTVGTLVRSDHKGISNQYVSDDKCIVDGPNLIRRLTPLECERLQGFPDGWTNIPSASDSARYKALGNSVAIPCVEFVMRGIALALRQMRRRRG